MTRGGAGRYQHRVRVQALTETRGSDGGLVNTYVDRFERWARIDPLQPSEQIEARAVKGFTSHQMEMHYTPEIKPTDRIVFRGRNFDVEGVWHPLERKDVTNIIAVEVSDG